MVIASSFENAPGLTTSLPNAFIPRLLSLPRLHDDILAQQTDAVLPPHDVVLAYGNHCPMLNFTCRSQGPPMRMMSVPD